MTIHVFSDASVGPCGFAGAYVVGGGKPIGIRFEASTSTEAELLTLEAAVRDARRLHPKEPIVVHTDLLQIHFMLLRLRARGSAKLNSALRECEAEIVGDGNQHGAHRICHRHARITAGILGTQHPDFVGPKRKKVKKPKGLKPLPNMRPTTREKFRAVIEAIKNNPLGASEVRLSQESGIGLNDTHKILRKLQGHCKVRCDKPAGVAGCDLAQWKWFQTPQFGTLLGELLQNAGVS
jgi:hypothetical protein